MIIVNTRVRIAKGCRALNLTKGATARVSAIEAMGPDYSHAVRVTLVFLNSMRSGDTVVLYARHLNRLADREVRLNRGNPLNYVTVVER